jgi:Fic family protein
VDKDKMKEELKKRFLDALKEYHSLGIAEQIDYKKFYLYSLITHSTAIEGSTVTEIENQLLFDEGITAKGRSLQEQMMNLDLKAAYEHSMRLAHQHEDFSVEMLKSLSAIVMKNTGASYNTAQGSFDASKGELRLVGVTAGIGGRSYMNYQKVPAKLEELCKQLNQRRNELSNLDDIVAKYLLSFDAHYQLVTIHPWVDGNGRMSRLIMNHLQYEFGLIPVKIVKEDKAEYIQALIDAREQDSLEPFREFMMEEHIKNINKEIEEYNKSQENDPIKVASDQIKVASDPIKERLFQAVLQDGTLNYAEYAAIIGVSEATVKRRLGELKKEGAIIRVGSNKTGHWEIKNNRRL